LSNLPQPPKDPTGLPDRTLSSHDFELVIKRAAELQAKEAEDATGDAMTGAEVMRIGRELGLSTRHLHQALAEVGGAAAAEPGFFARVWGPTHVHIGRAVRGTAAEVSQMLERHFVEREFLVVLRRLPDRLLFTRATGVLAVVGRATSKVGGSRPLDLTNLEMSVVDLEEGYSYVNLATAMKSHRAGTAIGSFLIGGWGAGAAAAFLGIAIAPPAALLALPVLGGVMYGGHVVYESLLKKAQLELESFLDRLEHGELPTSSPRRGPMGPFKK
jgi:hypothetical protein